MSVKFVGPLSGLSAVGVTAVHTMKFSVAREHTLLMSAISVLGILEDHTALTKILKKNS
jgi:hypothetical protein